MGKDRRKQVFTVIETKRKRRERSILSCKIRGSYFMLLNTFVYIYTLCICVYVVLMYIICMFLWICIDNVYVICVKSIHCLFPISLYKDYLKQWGASNIEHPKYPIWFSIAVFYNRNQYSYKNDWIIIQVRKARHWVRPSCAKKKCSVVIIKRHRTHLKGATLSV